MTSRIAWLSILVNEYTTLLRRRFWPRLNWYTHCYMIVYAKLAIVLKDFVRRRFATEIFTHIPIQDLVVRAFVQSILYNELRISGARRTERSHGKSFSTYLDTINSNMHTNFQSQRLEQAIDIINSNTKSCTRIL